MTIDKQSLVKVAAAFSPVQLTEKQRSIPAAFEAIGSEAAAAAAPLQGRVTLSAKPLFPKKEKVLEADHERVLRSTEATRLATLLQTEVFSIRGKKVLLSEFVDALQKRFKNEIRLIGSSVGHIVTGQEEYKDIDLFSPVFIKVRLDRGWREKDLQISIARAIKTHGRNVRAAIEEVVLSFYPKEAIVSLLNELEFDNISLKEECQTVKKALEHTSEPHSSKLYSNELYEAILTKIFKRHFSLQVLINNFFEPEKGGGNRFSLLKIGETLPVEVKSVFNVHVYEDERYLTTINGLSKTCAFFRDGLHIPLSQAITGGESKILSLACPIKDAETCLRQRLLVVEKADGTEFIRWLDLITLRGFVCSPELRDETFGKFLEIFSLENMLRSLDSHFPEKEKARRIPSLLNLLSLCKNVEKAHLLKLEIEKKINTCDTSEKALLEFFTINPKIHLFDNTALNIITQLIDQKIIKSHKQLETCFKFLSKKERKKLCLNLVLFHPEIARPFNAAVKLKTLLTTYIDLSYIDLKISPERALELFSKIQDTEDPLLISLCFELLKVAKPQDESILLTWLPKAYPSLQQKEGFFEYLADLNIILDPSLTTQEVILKIISSKPAELGLLLFKHASKQKLWGEGSERTLCLMHLIAASNSEIREELWNLIEDRASFIESFLNAEENPERTCYYILKSSVRYSQCLENAYLRVIRNPPSNQNTLKIVKMALDNKQFAEMHRSTISKLFPLLPQFGSQLLSLCQETNFSISIDIDSLTDVECQKFFSQIDKFHEAYFDAVGLRLAKRLQIADESLFIHFLARGFFKLTQEEQETFPVQNPKTPGELTIQMIRSTTHGFILYEWMCKEKLWNTPVEQQEAAFLLLEKASPVERQLIWRSLEDKSSLLEKFITTETDPSCQSDYLSHPSLPLNEKNARAMESLFESLPAISKENFALFLNAIKNPHFIRKTGLIKLSPAQAREALPYFKDSSDEDTDFLLEKGFSEEFTENKKLLAQLMTWLPNTDKRLELAIRGLRENDISFLNDKIVKEYLNTPINFDFQEVILQLLSTLCDEYIHTPNAETLDKIFQIYKKLNNQTSLELLNNIRDKIIILFSQLNEKHYTEEIVSIIASGLKELLAYRYYSNPKPLQSYVIGCIRSRSDLIFMTAFKQAIELKEKFPDATNERVFQLLLRYESKSTSTINFNIFGQIFIHAFSIESATNLSPECTAYFKKLLQTLPKNYEVFAKTLKENKEKFASLVDTFLRVPVLRNSLIQEYDLFYVIERFAFLNNPKELVACVMDCAQQLRKNRLTMPVRNFMGYLQTILLKLNDIRDTSCEIDHFEELYEILLILTQCEEVRQKADCTTLIIGILINQISKESKLSLFFNQKFKYIIKTLSVKEGIDDAIAFYSKLIKSDSVIRKVSITDYEIQKPHLTFLILSFCNKDLHIQEIIQRIRHNYELVGHTLSTLHGLSCQIPLVCAPSHSGIKELFDLIPPFIRYAPYIPEDILSKCLQIYMASDAPDPSMLMKLFIPCMNAYEQRVRGEMGELQKFKEQLAVAMKYRDEIERVTPVDTPEKLHFCITEIITKFDALFSTKVGRSEKVENLHRLNHCIQQLLEYPQPLYPPGIVANLMVWRTKTNILLGKRMCGKLMIDEKNFDPIITAHLKVLANCFIEASGRQEMDNPKFKNIVEAFNQLLMNLRMPLFVLNQ